MSLESIYDLKLIRKTIIWIIVFGIGYFCWDETTKFFIRYILESRLINYLIWSVTILVYIFHYIKHKNKDVESETIITKKFGIFVDNILGGFAYATIISTCLTILKGLFIQKFFTDKIYFIEFESIDLTSMLGLMLFFLWYASVKVIDTIKETYKVQNTEQVKNEKKEIINSNKSQ